MGGIQARFYNHGYNCMKGGDGNERLSDLATYQQQLGS